jgi:hypothetical protein
MASNLSVPPVVSDLVVGGLWAACAVKVGGYTWAAFSSTWSQLPAPGGTASQSASTGSSTTTDTILKDAKKAASIEGTITKPVVNAAKWFDKTDGKIVSKIPGLDKLPKWLQ